MLQVDLVNLLPFPPARIKCCRAAEHSAKRMSTLDHSSSALWQHPLRAVESPEASSPSPQRATSSLILFVSVYQDWSGEASVDPPPCCLPRSKTFPGPYLCALLQDNFYYLQITGSVTQLPIEASVLLEIDRVSRGRQLGQGQTTAGQVVFIKEAVELGLTIVFNRPRFWKWCRAFLASKRSWMYFWMMEHLQNACIL